ncbi:MAG: precorrin-4 C(11)-methyltransferase [Dehalococcoidales bacterium]|nr:precorrin-4 C(11)-methyltransferase [Dehalococcoidales bacterium]
MAQVYFIGAGPGDVELLTLKARKIIEKADVIIYADSLISPEILDFARAGAEVHKSASMNLEQITGIIVEAAAQGKTVARLQSGDPSIYGAIGEQMAALDEKGIAYDVIPGVSSLFAAAAALKIELTVPEVTQTVIITRLEGKTPVPVTEKLRSLAAHHSSIAIFLSVSMVTEVVSELLQGGYAPDTPAAAVYRASWKDQKVIRTTLDNLAEQVGQSGIKQQALILVGQCLERRETYSKLYDKGFRHGYR